MKINLDTNVLVPSCVSNYLEQARITAKTLSDAALIGHCAAVLVLVCLRAAQAYNIENTVVISEIRALMACKNVEMNRPAAGAGLAVLNAGGDFTDGVIALNSGRNF